MFLPHEPPLELFRLKLGCQECPNEKNKNKTFNKMIYDIPRDKACFFKTFDPTYQVLYQGIYQESDYGIYLIKENN